MSVLPRSIGLRLTLALGAIALLVFASAAFLLHRSLAVELGRMSRAELASKIELVKRFTGDARAGRDLGRLREHLDEELAEHPGLRVWLQDAQGRALYGGPPPRIVARLDQAGHLALRRADGVAMEGLEETLAPASPIAHVLVGTETRAREQLLARYRNALVAGCAVAVLLSAALGAVATWRALAAVKRLSAQAARITPRSLTSRLSEGGVDRELAGLVGSFNGVLERLEEAYGQMEAFTADAAHELRTPLATLISGNQVMLSAPRSAAELREMLLSNLEDLERLNALVKDMLFLAHADRGETAASVEAVDLGVEADRTIEYWAPLMEEAGLRAERRGSATVVCNAAMIRRALSNLLTNAIKHADPPARISVDIEPLPDGGARLSVFNPGSPLAPAVCARMFDRFYRADEARPGSENHGLGLAIVQAIARLHGGRGFVEPGPDGNRVGFDIRPGGAVR